MESGSRLCLPRGYISYRNLSWGKLWGAENLPGYILGEGIFPDFTPVTTRNELIIYVAQNLG